jgi:hypothetical protein
MSSSPRIWRPPQWNSPATILITFPGQGQNTPQYSQASGIGATLPTAQTLYVFDAVIREDHEQRLIKTQHPIQTGASISDHAYLEPATLSLEIGMSDAMDAFYNPSTWVGSASKSISCFQTLLALQTSRIPLQVTTPYRTYTNMLITSPRAERTVKQFAGLRCVIEFEQIFMAQVLIPTNSARPQDTESTNQGQLTAQPPTTAQIQQSQYPPTYKIWDSTGAGDWSSDNTNLSQGLPAK